MSDNLKANNKRSFTGKDIFHMIITKNELGAIIPLTIILVIVAILNPNFFGVDNIIDILRTANFSLMVAVPLTFLLTGGGMDLSVGAVMSLGGIVSTYLIKAGVPIVLSIIIALCAGAFVGLMNGLIIVKFKQPAFITTLGTQYVVNGFCLVVTGGQAITGLPNSFKVIGQSTLFKIPYPVLYALVIGIIGFIILNKSKYGRAISAIGGNPETAYLAGIPVVKRRMSVFAAVSLCAALTGVVYASRFSSGLPAAGTGVELKMMAAVIIGGTSMSGGAGTILGTAIGCILLATITNFLILIGVSSISQTLIFGIILLVAIFIDRYRRQVIGGE